MNHAGQSDLFDEAYKFAFDDAGSTKEGIEFGEKTESPEANAVLQIKHLVELLDHTELIRRELAATTAREMSSLSSTENRAYATERGRAAQEAIEQIQQDYQSRLLDLISENVDILGADFLGDSYDYYKALEGDGAVEGVIPAEILESLSRQYDPKQPERVLRVGTFLVRPSEHPQLLAAINRAKGQKDRITQITGAAAELPDDGVQPRRGAISSSPSSSSSSSRGDFAAGSFTAFMMT